jgi:hypothetical protein
MRRGVWFLVLTLAGMAASSPAVAFAQQLGTMPSGLQLRLELKDGKTSFLLGEPIDLRLVFSGENSAYGIENGTNSDEYDTLNLSLGDSAWRWKEMDRPGAGASDVIYAMPITAEGVVIPIRLNDAFDFSHPGTYTLSVTTSRLRTSTGGRTGIFATTNAVSFSIAPMPPEEEARRVKALIREIDEDKEDSDRRIAAGKLATLRGDAAAREKVRLYLVKDQWFRKSCCVCEPIDDLIETGLDVSGPGARSGAACEDGRVGAAG